MSFRAASLALAVLALACGGKSSTGDALSASGTSADGETATSQPDDAAAYYGPCVDNEWCGKGTGLTLNALGGLCICVVACEQDVDCPVPMAPALPECKAALSGDPRCVLTCQAETDCPADFSCVDGECWIVAGP